MTEDDGYYYHSDHVLDNMTPEEELAVSLFQQAIAAGKINPTAAIFDDTSFLHCIDVAERVTELLIIRHAEADAAAETDPKSKFKVVPIKKEAGSESN